MIYLVLIGFFCAINGAIMANRESYRFYKLTYNMLKKFKINSITMSHDEFIAFADSYTDYFKTNNSVILYKNGDIKLYCPTKKDEINNQYLHNKFHSWLDPYSLYWLIKINRYKKNNLNDITV